MTINNNRSAVEIVTRAIDAAGQAGGSFEVEAIAAKGPGAMTFSEKDMALLLAAYGSPGDALYAIQLEAQRRVSHAALVDVVRRVSGDAAKVRR